MSRSELSYARSQNSTFETLVINKNIDDKSS